MRRANETLEDRNIPQLSAVVRKRERQSRKRVTKRRKSDTVLQVSRSLSSDYLTINPDTFITLVIRIAVTLRAVAYVQTHQSEYQPHYQKQHKPPK